jgi:hypothetical protein
MRHPCATGKARAGQGTILGFYSITTRFPTASSGPLTSALALACHHQCADRGRQDHMALIDCRQCKSEFSDTSASCPRCGICTPTGTGTLTFIRPGLSSAEIGVEVFVDGQPQGKLRPMGWVSVQLPPGNHHVGLTSSRAMSTLATISTGAGDTSVKVGFTFMGSPQLS